MGTPDEETESTITWTELARAVQYTSFTLGQHPVNRPGTRTNIPSALSTQPGAIARALFTHARQIRAQRAQWVTGDHYLHEPEGADPQVYRREKDGWWCYSSRSYHEDGQLITTGFVHLVSAEEPGAKPPGAGPPVPGR